MYKSLYLLIFLISVNVTHLQSALIVWDDYIDLCRQNNNIWRSNRDPDRCENSTDIIVAKQLYRDEEPFWCIKVNNVQGHYELLKIHLTGDNINRYVETSKETQRYKINDTNQEIFKLSKNIINTLIISPARPLHKLQRIISLKIDDNEMCKEYRSNEVDKVYTSQKNTLLTRHLKKCYFIGSRIHRPRNRCELNNDVTMEDMSLRGEEYFICIIIDNTDNSTNNTNNENEQTLEIMVSNGDYLLQNVSKKKYFISIKKYINSIILLLSKII